MIASTIYWFIVDELADFLTLKVFACCFQS